MEPTADQRLKAALVEAIDNHRAGRLDLAEALYGEILGAHPDHSQTLYLLGVLGLQRGAFGKAAGLLQRVIDLRPDHAEAKFSLGRAFGALGRPEEAEAMFRACLALAPDHADARLSLGTAQQARGAYGDAEASFHRVLEIDPKSYRALANLGSLCMLFGRGSEGEAYLAQAVALRPDDPQLLCNLAASYKGQGRLTLALETYDRVLGAEPVNVEALAGKANVLEKMGEDQAALDLTLPLVEAGNTNPNVALIFAALASGAGRSDQALALLQRILNSQTTGTEQRCKLLFAEARLLEQAGEYDRAFQAVSAANDLVPRTFDVAGHDRRIDRIIETYGAETFPRLPRAGNESKLPVFIVGMPRSGKSLSEQILASHPAVFGTGELPYMDRAARSLAAGPGMEDGYLERVGELDREALDQIAEAHLAKLHQRGGQAIRVTDTMPYNYLLLGFIAQLFPKARIIHCLRDPLDTCLACFFKDFRYANAQTTDLVHLGAYYRSYRRLMDHWHRVLDVPILTVHYEDLVADSEAWSRKLVDFADLDWDPHCLHFHESQHTVESASYDVVREPLNTRWVGLWRHYEGHLGPLQKALAGPE
jgi:tetratricopeptide (TPR) repeat protein